MNTLFHYINNGSEGYITVDSKAADEFEKLVKETTKQNTFERFESGNVPLVAMPKETRDKVMSVLRAFDEVSVEYENGGFRVFTGSYLSASYAIDHFFCGRYRADEVYTREQRRQNFIEEFGYDPAFI